MPPPADRPPDLAGLTDLCVKCGLCLPHCPTYGLSRQEGDSPRGRIALVQGLATGRLEPDERLTGHLTGCLTCRRCETVCPARVPYGRIADAGRALLRASGRGDAPGAGTLRWLARREGLLRHAPALLAAARRLGLAALARRLRPDHWLTRALTLSPRAARAPRAGRSYPARGTERGEVALFLGCVARGLDGATLAATVEAATALGFRVRVPAGQGCCGALDLHAGRAEAAAEQAARNARAFGAGGDQPVLCAATGCAITLAEAGDGAAGGLPARSVEATRFFAAALGDRPLTGPARRLRVAVHTSCTARLLPGRGEDVAALLARIPNTEIVPLSAAGCCGAAGDQFLTRGAQADALRAPLLDEIARLGPDHVVSANAGCALHLAAGLAERGQGRLPVTHPVALLARALAGNW